MQFLKNLSIRSKLVLISLIPLLALVYFLQGIVTAGLSRKNTTEQVYRDFLEVEKLSALVHQIQKERGLTLAFLQSETQIDKNKITEQREMTNRAVTEVFDIYRLRQKNTTQLALLDSLPHMRKNIQTLPDQLNMIKATLLAEIGNTSKACKNVDIKNLFEAHLFLLYAKEYLARMRATIAGSIIAKEFQKNDYGEFSSAKGRHEMNIYRFRESASPELLDFFRKKTEAPAFIQTYSLINAVFGNPGVINSMTYDDWWTNASEAIGLFKEAEDFSIGRLKERTTIEQAAIASAVTTNIAVAASVIVLIVLLVTLVIREIAGSIAKLKTAAEKITKGDVNFAVDITSKDEIGDLAGSFNRMIDVAKGYALVADAIGKGEYDAQVNVRGESDLLGKALNTMKINLQKLSQENETRTWLLTGAGELNDKMRGEKESLNLAQDTIDHITSYLKAQIGAIYVRENGHLSLAGSYAFHQRKNNASVFAIGEGMVGQAAREKKPIVFNDIPGDYIKINSGLGNAVPRNILVYPVLYEGEVKGVIEIGSAREFSELDLQFLQTAGDNIAIAFNGAQSRTQLKELLAETQRQAEELEVQQEELKQSNEELLEKTQLLEKSEAELKTQQEELQQTNEELEEKANLLEDQKQVVENAKIAIENKARELEATSKYKSEFLANMSHELRTPLNSILILSQILADNKNKTLGEKEVQFAINICNSGTDLLNLINEILDLAKVEAGKMELDINEFKVDEVIKDVNSMFSEIARDKAVDLEVKTTDLSPQHLITSDKQRLEQIIRNLLSNAFKFTEKNGRVSLSISKAGPHVAFNRPELTAVKDVLAFSVTDTGIGIPREKLSIIFEAFQQVDGSTKRKYGGTGLGLSISRELAHTLGGEVHVESEEGAGSTFTLYLPSVFDPAMISSGSRHVGIREKNGRRTKETIKTDKAPTTGEIADDDKGTVTAESRVILIMEDDIAFARVLLDFVRERQYKGIVADQGNTGLSFARHYKPDAILLDMKLPVMDGAEVLRQLKNDPELRHIPVQIISGYDMKKQGLELGALGFIRKPVTHDGLRKAFDKIEDFISRRMKRLLIVEDDRQHNESVKELIGNGDVKCFSAYSGTEAYEMLTADPFDCVIVDLGLPDMSGFQLLEKIKESSNLNRIPVIVYTGKDLTREENITLEKLANTVVVKTAYSHERLLDETMLFLHRVESKLPKEKQSIIRKLHKTDEVLKNKRVLIVDDDLRNVYSLVNALEEEGMQCTSAENGKKALLALRQSDPVDIILMDVMMPEMDGYEATQEIRKMDKLKKIPVIALTAKAMKGDREKCLEAGMSDYISKPLNVEKLLSLMRVWLYA